MLRILTYHRVAEPRETLTLDPRLINATPTTFTQQMRYLAQHYAVVSLEEVLHAVQTGTCFPKRAVLLTFDDAYRDFGDIAWPILQRYRLPATLFVPTGYPDQPEQAFWWDRLYRAIVYTAQTVLSESPLGALPLGTTDQRYASLRSLQSYLKTMPHAAMMELVEAVCAELVTIEVVHRSVLNWDELRQLAREGVTLAAHTQTHAILPQLSPAQIREEIIGSQQDLQREIGRVLPVFGYPGGAHDHRVVTLLQEAGFVLAFTTRHGTALHGAQALDARDLLRLRRTNITQRTSLPIFRLRLSHLGASLDKWRYRMRGPLSKRIRT